MRAAYSVWAGGETKEKPAGETGRRKRMRGIVGYFTVLMAWINIFFFSQKKKNNLLLCLRDALFSDKTIQSPSRPRWESG